MKILMVCLGNICRSPLAQGILEEKMTMFGLDGHVDSAGTGSWHIGESPDGRSVSIARENGINISHQKARQFKKSDFNDFDYILAMDSSNYYDITKQAENELDKQKVSLIMNYAFPGENRAVPDPYYDGSFQRVFDLLETACERFLEDRLVIK